MERVILHSDINNCFASIEAAIDPSLAGKPIAVCGNQQERHGIVLAKSEQAKKFGVYTGQTVYQAKRICPDLVVVSPHFEQYLHFSKLAQQLYASYTDRVEPFGLDECWLDVTGSQKLFGSGEQIAQSIRARIKKELGVTVSVGVSFNKVFAKLGSDIKKPDAVTVISKENYKDIVWHLPVRDILGVGRNTEQALKKRGIFTIGDIARAGRENMEAYFGKNGRTLWEAASGRENAGVLKVGQKPPVKSVSSGVTAIADMNNEQEAGDVIMSLCMDVSKHLHDLGLYAGVVQLALRRNDLIWQQYQTRTDFPLRSVCEIYAYAMKLIKNYNWELPLRSVSVRAAEVCPDNCAMQGDMIGCFEWHEKLEKADNAMYSVNQKYGKNAVVIASMLNPNKMPKGERINCLPGSHNQPK